MVFGGVVLFSSLVVSGQSIEFVSDPWEVRLDERWTAPNQTLQRQFREAPAWSESLPASSAWQVISSEGTSTPSRMWGPGISFEGTGEVRALDAWTWALESFAWDAGEIGPAAVAAF